MREIVANQLRLEAEQYFIDEIEVGESYFGGNCKVNRGRVSAGKVSGFKLLKHGG